jgi:hypothetical protein
VVQPPGATIAAGAGPLTFTTVLVGITPAGPVSWSLTGQGDIQPSGLLTARYVPPAAVAAVTTATLEAKAVDKTTGEVYDHHITITITP